MRTSTNYCRHRIFDYTYVITSDQAHRLIIRGYIHKRQPLHTIIMTIQIKSRSLLLRRGGRGGEGRRGGREGGEEGRKGGREGGREGGGEREGWRKR